MNYAGLSGRLTRDPELRYGKDDSPVARYSIAINKNRGQDTDYIPIVAFGKSAEFADKYLHKGMKIIVEGRIQTGSYINAEGVKINTFSVIADRQEFADSKGDKDGE